MEKFLSWRDEVFQLRWLRSRTDEPVDGEERTNRALIPKYFPFLVRLLYIPSERKSLANQPIL